MSWSRRRSSRLGTVERERRRLEIKILRDPNWYMRNVFGANSTFITSETGFYKILKTTPNSIKQRPFFAPMFSAALVDFIGTKIKTKEIISYGTVSYENPHNYRYTNLIYKSLAHLTADAKLQLVDLFLENHTNFTSLAKKELGALSNLFTNSGDAQIPDVLRTFYRNLKPHDFEALVEKLPDKYDNPTVKDVLSKTKLFEYLKYNSESIKDPKVKSELVKAIARTPTLTKRIGYRVEVTKENIKAIAPAMRFKFLQFAYKTEIFFSGYGYLFGETLKSRVAHEKKRRKTDCLVMPAIPPEEIEEILFSVSLQKHADFLKWTKQYRRFYDALHSNQRIDYRKYE